MAFHNVPPNGFPDLPDMEELEAVVKDVTALKTSVSGLTEDVSDLNEQKANQITIAPFFNSETSYDIGDLVYYNGLTYRCTNAHEGEWDADDFVGTTIANELDTLKSGLTNKIGVSTTTNLDECFASGIYNFLWDATGVPSGHTGVMLVMRTLTADTGVQIARVATENTIYVRFFDAAVFTAWQTITLGS